MERNQIGRKGRQTTNLTVFSMSALLIGALFLGGSLWAQPQDPPAGPPGYEGGPGGHGCGGGMQGLSKRLGLTEDQMTKIDSLRLEFSKETADLDAQIHKKQLDMAGLLRDPQAKEDVITAVQKDLSKLMVQREDKAHAYRLKARNLLTPEQIKNLPVGCSLGIPGGGPKGCGLGMGPGKCGGCPWTM